VPGPAAAGSSGPALARDPFLARSRNLF